MASTNKRLWKEYNGKGFYAESAGYAERVATDLSGNSLNLTLVSDKVSKIGGKSIAAASATSATQDASGNVITATYATKSEVAEAIADVHTHSNKAILDATTASYTTGEQTKLGGIETGAQANVIESVKLAGTALTPDANKAVDIVLDYASDSDIEDMFIENVVKIGGRNYRTVNIGNQVWLAENLDFTWDGLTVLPDTPSDNIYAGYHNDDKTKYGIDGTIYPLGLRYTWYAVKMLNDNRGSLLPEGWHVPSKNEWEILISTVGESAATKLEAENNSINGNWPTNWNGTDIYGFGILPANDYDFPTAASYYTSTDYPDTIKAPLIGFKSRSYDWYSTSKDMTNYLRLVKDAT